MDDYFGQWYWIIDVTMGQQFKGIDREFTNMLTGKRWSFQYKTDYMSQKTGNLIIETVSNDVTDTPGWAYTCQANVLIYFRFYTGEMLALKPVDIRQALPEWVKQFREVPIMNDGYKTLGLTVPVNEVRRISFWQDHMPCDYLSE